MEEEGGYYAIKGFSYQYIVSLIEMLNCKDENKVFSFEQFQDFNDNELIYQMKYKETQHFTNSKIKEPTIKLFSEYLETKKDYVLYVYFPDRTDETLLFNTTNDLDKVLLNCKIDKKEYNFTENQKNEFINHFKVVFSKDYIDKSNELIELIRSFIEQTNDDIVVFTRYYENEISDKIEELKKFPNIIVKFGRYKPNQEPHKDEVLGVNLANSEQYAKRIS